jgi:hypothetical protein
MTLCSEHCSHRQLNVSRTSPPPTFGDAVDGPSGTFYHGGSEQVEYFWHMFDHVLIRPELLNIFRNEELRILTGGSETSFLTGNGLPKRSVASDHLPILFRLEM